MIDEGETDFKVIGLSTKHPKANVVNGKKADQKKIKSNKQKHKDPYTQLEINNSPFSPKKIFRTSSLIFPVF